jgi:hypothetical protein
MPEGVKSEPLYELTVDVAFPILDLKNARPNRNLNESNPKKYRPSMRLNYAVWGDV